MAVNVGIQNPTNPALQATAYSGYDPGYAQFLAGQTQTAPEGTQGQITPAPSTPLPPVQYGQPQQPQQPAQYWNQAQMSKDFNDLFTRAVGTKTGTWGGNTMETLGGGKARYTTADGRTVDINSGMSYDQMAELDPSIAGELQNAYGYRAQASPQKLMDLARQNAPQVNVDTGALKALGTDAGNRYKNYDNRIQGYYNDPSSFQLNPAYQAMMERGTEAVNRSAAAKGMLGAGNRLYELQKYGSDLANQAWNSEIQNLTGLAGMHGGLSRDALGQAGQLELGASQANAQSQANTLGNLLNQQQIGNQYDLGLRSWDTQDRQAQGQTAQGWARLQGDLYGQAGAQGGANWQDDMSWLGQLSGLGKGNAGQVGMGGGGFGNGYTGWNTGNILAQLFGLS